ncbi:MAG: prolipoprotein diacylglyceryl transferase family protein [Polyangiales bacterium]
MAYALCIFVGLVLAAFARRLDRDPPTPHRQALFAIAAIGALSGAMLFELPADFFGWTASRAGEPIVAGAIGGRTLLGGLLGGWIAVEAGKRGLGVTTPTGDGFALPLAIALACGRVGCVLTGCCAGRPLDGYEWWRAIAIDDGHCSHRFPAPHVEVVFHLACAVALYALMRTGALRHRRFAAYVALYAAFRFAIERVRDNPRIALGLTYYQWLSMPLLALGVGTLIARSRAARQVATT